MPGLVSSACEAVPKKVSSMSAGSHNVSDPKLVVRFGRSLEICLGRLGPLLRKRCYSSMIWFVLIIAST